MKSCINMNITGKDIRTVQVENRLTTNKTLNSNMFQYEDITYYVIF